MIERLEPYFKEAITRPDYKSGSKLIRIHDLSAGDRIPDGATSYVKTRIHEVKRPSGNTGYQIVNGYKEGVSLLPWLEVDGKYYVILHGETRYPLPREGYENLTPEEAAVEGVSGRWGLEAISGGVEEGETLVQAVIREAAEEAGVVGLQPDQITPLTNGALYSSVSTNRQSFNLYTAQISPEQWQPQTLNPDSDEVIDHVAAYPLELVERAAGNEIVEMSTITAIFGLVRSIERRRISNQKTSIDF